MSTDPAGEESEASRTTPAAGLTGKPAAAGIGRAVAAGMSGESVSAKGILAAIGGVRGIVESLLPAAVYLAVFVITQDARVSAIAPIVLSVLAIIVRLLRREPLSAAFSGFLGVIICVAATLLTGRGENYFLPGFWINGAWVVAHTVSILIGWPLIGLVLGFFRGSLTEWRRIPVLRRAATLCTAMWAAVFAARLAVQLPIYIAASNGSPGAVEALGIARLVMGIPLFAIAVLFTWLVLSRVSASYDADRADSQADAPAEAPGDDSEITPREP